MTDETQITELPNSTPEALMTPELTPGALLKAAREKAGVSVKTIANDMRVSLTIINALENDQYEKIAAETFVLGYIRSYVRQLNLSADAFIDAYHEYRQKHKLPAQAVGESTRRVEQVLKLNHPIKVHKPGSPWLKLVMWFLLLLVIVLVLFSVFGGQIAQKFGIDKPVIVSIAGLESGDGVPLGAAGEQQVIANPLEGVVAASVDGAAAETDQTEGVVDRTGAIASQVAGSEVAVESTVTTGQAPTSATAPAATSSTPAVVTPAAKPEAVAPVQAQAVKAVVNNPSVLTSSDSKAGLDTLVLKFTGECWLEVSDSRGDILTVELYQAGSSLTLQGEAPFDVLMGNVRAVSVTINGKAVPLQPEGDSKTLRTQIDKL